MGVVGTGVATVLGQKADEIRHRLGKPLVIRRVLVRDTEKRRSSAMPPALLTTQPSDVLHDPEVVIVIEVMGGEHPALEYIAEIGRAHV